MRRPWSEPRCSTAWPNGRPARFPPTTSHGACAPSTAPTTICCPARSSGAPPTSRFPNCSDPTFRPADGTLSILDGPGPAPAMPTAPNYNPSEQSRTRSSSIRSLRTISNLIVDQTLGNPAAILTAPAARRDRRRRDQMTVTRGRSTPPSSPLEPPSSAPWRDAERQDGGSMQLQRRPTPTIAASQQQPPTLQPPWPPRQATL